MNAINKAISEVYYHIPLEILNLGFNDNSLHPHISIDEVILSRVVRPKVLVDCNITGGVEVYVDISKCGVADYSTFNNREYVIDVPKHLTNNRSIITVLGVFSRTSKTNGSLPPNSDSPILNTYANQMNSLAPGGMLGTARTELIGENKVVIMNPDGLFVTGNLKCVVENNANLSNLNPRTHLVFSEMVILAVKAYLYNSLIVKLGSGYIQNGHELGVINDIISEYSSAHEEYRTYIKEVWPSVAFHNDKNRLGNIVSGLL